MATRHNKKLINHCAHLLTEAHIQETITQFLQLEGWRAFRTELTVQKERGRVVGERGQPDYLYIRYAGNSRFFQMMANAILVKGEIVARATAEVLWIEFKRPGEHCKPYQLAWHAAERNRGALVLVVDDIDYFMKEWYPKSGLQRKVT